MSSATKEERRPLNLRASAGLLSLLKEAADMNDVSLTHEASRRLEGTFRQACQPTDLAEFWAFFDGMYAACRITATDTLMLDQIRARLEQATGSRSSNAEVAPPRLVSSA